MIGTFFFLLIAATSQSNAETIVVECQGRTYQHRMVLESTKQLRYERRMYFGNTLQETFPVILEGVEPTFHEFTFTSIENGLLFSATASGAERSLHGQQGRLGSGTNYRRPDSGGPLDFVKSCWIQYRLLESL